MRNHLVQKTCEIELRSGTILLRFTAPSWAKGFKCEPGSCGLCCMVEPPEKTPRKRFALLDTSICQFYSYPERICTKYTQRPWGCRTYPFIFGIEDKELKVSTMLGCPATNVTTDVDLDDLKATFCDPAVKPSIEWIFSMFNDAKRSELWKDADNIWNTVSKNVEKYISRLRSFPFLLELRSLVLNAVDDCLDIPKSRREHPKVPPFLNVVRNMSKGYIATGLSSCKVWMTKLHGTKMRFTSFDPKSRKTTTIKKRIPIEPPQLEIEKRSRELLADYGSLMVRRPFLFLGAVSSRILPQVIPMSSSDHLVGAFLSLEVGASVISARESTSEIDKKTMREILSFSEACVHSQFKAPDRALSFGSRLTSRARKS